MARREETISAWTRDTARAPGGLEHVIRCLLADGVDRRDNEETRNLGEDRGIDDTEVARAVYDEVRVDNATLFLFAQGTGARRVVAPRVVLDEGGDVLIAAGNLFV